MSAIQLWRAKYEKERLVGLKSTNKNLFSLAFCLEKDYRSRIKSLTTEWNGNNEKVELKQFLKFLEKLVNDPLLLKRYPNGFYLFWGIIACQKYQILLPAVNKVKDFDFHRDYKFKFENFEGNIFPALKTYKVFHMGIREFVVSRISNDVKVIKRINVDFSFSDQRNIPPTLKMVKADKKKMPKYLKEIETALRGSDKIIVGANHNVLGLVALDKFSKDHSLKFSCCVEVNMDFKEAFNEILTLSIDKLQDCLYVQRRNALEYLFHVINSEEIDVSYLLDLNDILEAVRSKSVEVLYVWEDLQDQRLTAAEKPYKAGQHDLVPSGEPLIIRLAGDCQTLGVRLEIVTKDTEGIDSFLEKTKGLAAVMKRFQ